MSDDRPLVVFVSDIHLTDALASAAVPKRAVFERFWTRIQAARGARPARLCFVGDLFDIVRSPRWFQGSSRPHHDPGPEVVAVVEAIVDRDFEWWNGALVSRTDGGALTPGA